MKESNLLLVICDFSYTSYLSIVIVRILISKARLRNNLLKAPHWSSLHVEFFHNLTGNFFSYVMSFFAF